MRIPALALAAWYACSAASAQTAGWQPLYREDFEHGVPSDWNLASGWTLETEAGNTYLAANTHLTASLRLGPWTDFRLKARVRLIENGVMLNFRTSGCNRYMVPFRANGFQFGANGPDCAARGMVKTVNGSYALNQWYTMEVVGVGGTIRVYLDGALKLEWVDPTPLVAGAVSLECLSRAHFDDVEISGPPPPVFPAWVKTGGPIGGLGYDVRMRPDNPDVMLVTDTFSGVSMSLDGGHNWFAANQGITSRTGSSGDAIPVFCLTIDPRHPDVVWAGTQGTRGIFKSTDGGKSWVEKTSGIVERSGISFRGISVDPNDSDTVYAAAEISSSTWAGKKLDGREFDLTKGVVYRTRDGGQSWTPVWRGDNLARYVWIDPRDSSVIYISTGIFDREASNSDLLHGISGGVGIVKSTDGGTNWQPLNGANGLENLYVGSLFLHPQNPDILLAGVGMAGDQGGAGPYLSTDGGAHWQRGTLTGSGRVIQDLITAVEFAAADPLIAYAAGPNVFYRSEDGGRRWTLRDGGPPDNYYGPPGIRGGFPVDLQVDPRNPDRVFINNYGGGNFLSEDGGKSWQVASRGYTGAQLHRVAVDPTDEGNVYVIGRSGPFRSRDRGDNWTALMSGPARFAEWYAISVDPAHPATVLMSDEHNGILLRSADGGATWSIVFDHPLVSASDSRTRHGFKSIAFAPSNPLTVYAGLCRDRASIYPGTAGSSFGVYKSTDGGLKWSESNDAVSTGENIHNVMVDPRNESLVYAGTFQSGVLKSQDGGHTWQKSNQGLPGLDVRALALDPRAPWVLYAGFEKGGLYRSTDAGATWQVSGVGMDPHASIRDVVVDPTNSAIVYAADLLTGVYRSEDGGKLWVVMKNGLSTRAVTSLAISSDGGTLYAATEGEGVFRLDLKAGK